MPAVGTRQSRGRQTGYWGPFRALRPERSLWPNYFIVTDTSTRTHDGAATNGRGPIAQNPHATSWHASGPIRVAPRPSLTPKSIADRMTHDARRLYRGLGLNIEPYWHAVLLLVDQSPPKGVAEIARRIGSGVGAGRGIRRYTREALRRCRRRPSRIVFSSLRLA